MINRKYSNITYHNNDHYHYLHDIFITTYSSVPGPTSSFIYLQRGRKKKRKTPSDFFNPLSQFSSHEGEVSKSDDAISCLGIHLNVSQLNTVNLN